jgi:hypothetical protein
MARKKLRVGLVGVGNCASSFVQGLTHYAEATTNAPPPGLMHVDLGGYHVSDIEIAAAFDIHAGKVGRDLVGGDRRGAQQHHDLRPAARPWRHGAARADPGRRRQVPGGDIEESDAPVSDVAEELRAAARTSWCPTCRSAPRRRRNSTPSRRWPPAAPSSTASRCSSPRTRPGRALRAARAADHRRRHQEPGRRHHRPPGAGQPVPRARRADRPHLPAELRRQHRLQEHARTRAPAVQEDLQDPGGHQPVRRAARPTTCMSDPATSCPG